MSGPSAKAVAAAARTVAGAPSMRQPEPWCAPETISKAEAVVSAIHDPALGLDRSVCLRDIVEALRLEAMGDPESYWTGVACFIEEQFGGEG